jgi:hypothetical protein
LQGVRICTPDVPFEPFDADIALMTHCSRLADLFEPMAKAAGAGPGVLTIAEDAFEPFHVDTLLVHLSHQRRALESAGGLLSGEKNLPQLA